MSREFTLGQLTEGIRDRNVGQDGGRLMNKWTRTGLLRGLQETKRENMARLLENQAAQVLREANTMGNGAGGSGNIDGFSNIAFPIVRRVFGGLVANELVSIQPMSLPSGLLFYLDYSYGSQVGGEDSGALTGLGNQNNTTNTAATFEKGDSLYGSPSGAGVRTGADAIGGMYDLAGSTYSKVYVTGSSDAIASAATGVFIAATTKDTSLGAYHPTTSVFTPTLNIETTNIKNLKLLDFDPQLVTDIAENSTEYQFLMVDISNLTGLDKTLAKGISLVQKDGVATQTHGLLAVPAAVQDGTGILNVRRLNRIGTMNDTTGWTDDITGDDLLMVVRGTGDNSGDLDVILLNSEFRLVFPKSDSSVTAGADGVGSVLTIPSFESSFGSDPTPIIPEIDIKIESIAVTAQTRKLRARWSPELAQDLNAYHSLDAEVELTQILSEQIALEIDREILNDLLVEAKGANFFWSRKPGKFINKRTAAPQTLSSTLSIGPAFTGTVREWYETLVETIIDVANEIHRKTLRGSANFIVVSPEVATIFEASVLYKPSIKIDGQGQVAAPFSLGAEAIGSLTNRFTVYKDPYFPRNKILVGYKGGSYLESGYVYAPYVPLIVTPTIFAPEDFTPRKGVMTRYGKKMVRADFYGTVTCLDMDVI